MVLDNQIICLDEDVLNANIIKDVVLRKLEKDKIITEKQFQEYSENYNIVIIKYSWFEKWFNKIKSKNKEAKDGYFYQYIKMD